MGMRGYTRGKQESDGTAHQGKTPSATVASEITSTTSQLLLPLPLYLRLAAYSLDPLLPLLLLLLLVRRSLYPFAAAYVARARTCLNAIGDPKKAKEQKRNPKGNQRYCGADLGRTERV